MRALLTEQYWAVAGSDELAVIWLSRSWPSIAADVRDVKGRYAPKPRRAASAPQPRSAAVTPAADAIG